MATGTVVLPRALRPIECGPLVRLGAERDGGYVVPAAAVADADVLLSFGLSANWEFEKAFLAARREEGRDLAIQAYDHTVDARSLRNYQLKSLAHFATTGRRDFWDAARRASGFRAFFDGRRAIHYKEQVGRDTGPAGASLDTIMGRIDPEARVFLSMDIEGDEYRIADALPRFAPRFCGMGIEFHDLDLQWERFLGIHASLTEHLAIAHVHVNNVKGLGPAGLPILLEVTYIARSLLAGDPAPAARTYPLRGLDQSNAVELPDFRLEFA
jgi:hypothetical protein